MLHRTPRFFHYQYVVATIRGAVPSNIVVNQDTDRLLDDALDMLFILAKALSKPVSSCQGLEPSAPLVFQIYSHRLTRTIINTIIRYEKYIGYDIKILNV